MNTCIHTYAVHLPTHYGREVNFPSPKLVALPGLQPQVYPTSYLIKQGFQELCNQQSNFKNDFLVESFLYPDKRGTPEEGRRIQRSKRCVLTYHNKDKDTHPKNRNQDDSHQALSKKIQIYNTQKIFI